MVAHNARNIAQQRFGRLVAVCRVGVNNDRDKKALWLLACDCGGEALRTLSDLARTKTRGCNDCVTSRISTSVRRHGAHLPDSVDKRLYSIWIGIKDRCYNANEPRYRDYGAKGIAICDEWLSDFGAFRAWARSHGYGDTLTIDRLDSAQGYSPENCEWVTLSENSRRMWASMTPERRAEFISARTAKQIAAAQARRGSVLV